MDCAGGAVALAAEAVALDAEAVTTEAVVSCGRLEQANIAAYPASSKNLKPLGMLLATVIWVR